jgi:hypothetical protein
MKQPTVLIADDEIPYDDDRDRHTREAFRKTRPNATEQDYLEGYNGMRGAVQALKDAGFELTIARRFKEAEHEIAEKSFDVAVIDLGWAAEPDLEDREIAGMRLVNAMQESASGRLTRVIMYSSRFDEKRELAETAVQLRTLPLLKTYTPGSHQTLIAAVRFLASRQPTPKEVAFSTAVEHWKDRSEELRKLSKQFRIIWPVVAAVIIGGVATLVWGKTRVAVIQVSGSVLVTLLLGFISHEIRVAVADVQHALDTIINQGREMRPTRGAG